MTEQNIKEKYRACLLLHALGDTIGFNNGAWEFNNYVDLVGKSQIPNYGYTLEILYEFIQLGGINDINLEGWKVSDDTVLHLAMAETFLECGNTEMNRVISCAVKHLIKASQDMTNRYPGKTTMENIKKLESGDLKIKYNINYGGCGASIRSSCIGLVFPHKNQREQLIEYALELGRLTHNSASGFLGGITSALFTSYAIQNVPVNEWAFRLIKILESGKIENYLKKTRELDDYNRDKHVFIDKWRLYVEHKFSDKKEKKIEKNKSLRNLIQRIKYYHENFEEKNLEDKSFFPGKGGDDSVIIAYDCLLDCNGKWETLVVYSMLHIGDSDSTGCIAGSWFGALYGLDRIPAKTLEYIEYKDRILKIAQKIFDQFYNLREKV